MDRKWVWTRGSEQVGEENERCNRMPTSTIAVRALAMDEREQDQEDEVRKRVMTTRNGKAYHEAQNMRGETSRQESMERWSGGEHLEEEESLAGKPHHCLLEKEREKVAGRRRSPRG